MHQPSLAQAARFNHSPTMSTVLEIKAAIDALPLVERIDLVQLLNADTQIPHPPGGLDLEADSPELEAELLKAATQPDVGDGC